MASPAFAFSVADLTDAQACTLEGRLDDLTAALGRAPGYYEPIPLTVWWSLPSTSTPDRIWSLRLLGPEALPMIRAFARGCADRARGHANATDATETGAATEAAEAAAEAAADADAAARATEAAEAADWAAWAAAWAPAAWAPAAKAAERAAQRADLDRLFLGVDVEGVDRG